MQVNLSFLNTVSGKVILSVLIVLILLFVLFRHTGQVNKPCVVGVALPGSNVPVDQRSVQVSVGDRPWEVSTGVGAGRFDNKDAYVIFVSVKYKF